MEARSMMTLKQFNEHVLKGKSVAELYGLIEDFKIEIVFLKIQIEQKNIATFTLPPAEMTSKINSYRLYIKDTYKQIEKIAGMIERADDEAFAIQFQENLSNIHKVDYQIGGYFKGIEEYHLTFEDDQVVVTNSNSHEESSVAVNIDKEPFLKEFADLHIGEWRESYSDSDYGEQIMDGTSWSVNVHFTNKIDLIQFGGSNAFPYNFGTFNKLIMKSFNK